MTLLPGRPLLIAFAASACAIASDPADEVGERASGAVRSAEVGESATLLSECQAVLAPPPNASPPLELSVGPWYRCGALGSGAARVIEVSADGSLAVAITDAGEAFALELPSLALRGVFSHGTGRVSFAALSSDGALLATVEDLAGTVGLWDVASGALLHIMSRAPNPVSLYDLGDAAFSPDGSRLAVVSASGADVYDVATGIAQPIGAFDQLGAMRVAFASDGARLVLGRFTYFGNGPYAGWGDVDVVDTDTGGNSVRLAYSFHIRLPSFAVAGDTVAVAPHDGLGAVSRFNALSGAAIATPALTGAPLAMSADGSRIALRAGDENGQPEGPIAVYDLSDATLRRTLETSSLGPVAVTDDLELALVGDVPPHIVEARRLDGTAEPAVACGTGPADPVVRLAQSLDGAVLVATAMDASAELTPYAWDTTSGNPVEVPPPEGLEEPSPISPDGRSTARPAAEPNFELVDNDTGEVIRSFGPHESRVVRLEFSPDGADIASAGQRDPADRRRPSFVKVWSAATAAELRALPAIDGVAPLFHPAGDRLFVAGQGTVTAWCR